MIMFTVDISIMSNVYIISERINFEEVIMTAVTRTQETRRYNETVETGYYKLAQGTGRIFHRQVGGGSGIRSSSLKCCILKST